MNLVKCGKNHYYDSDRFSSCPHCISSGGGGDSVTMSMFPELSNMTMANALANVTVDMPLQVNSDPVTRGGDSTGAMTDDLVTQKSQGNTVMDRMAVNSNSSVRNGMDVVPDDEGVTINYYNSLMEKMEAAITTGPVVGWLVCTSGKYFGQSFPLKSGRNFVGRSYQMDVCLEGESSVSRDRHAVIIYEPKGRVFLAQPGDSRELFYLNDKVVLDNEKLEPYDILAIGRVEMMLIPFCTARFAWEDLEKKEEGKEPTIRLAK